MALRSLVTGGAGFVGSHLAEELLHRGEEVHIIDDLSTGRIDNIEHLKPNSRFHYLVDSVHNEPVLAELVDRCDVVYHLAAAAGVKLIVESPVNTIETNVHGTEVVLKHANQEKEDIDHVDVRSIRKINRGSFSGGSGLGARSTTKGRWSCACSKAIDEFLAIAYWHEKHLPVVIVRLFNTDGPRQTGRYGMVIPNFVQQAISGQPITVYGNGQQSRAFGYVGDAVSALANLANHPGAVGEVFNTQEITINELAELVKKMTGSNRTLFTSPMIAPTKKGFEDMPRRVPDISKIQRLMGYRPPLDLEGILERIIASIQNNGRPELVPTREAAS